MKVSPELLAEIIILRGLGFRHVEIAKRLGVGKSSVQYHLKKLRDEALKTSPDSVFKYRVCAKSVRYCVFSNLLEAMKEVEKIRGIHDASRSGD